MTRRGLLALLPSVLLGPKALAIVTKPVTIADADDLIIPPVTGAKLFPEHIQHALNAFMQSPSAVELHVLDWAARSMRLDVNVALHVLDQTTRSIILDLGKESYFFTADEDISFNTLVEPAVAQPGDIWVTYRAASTRIVVPTTVLDNITITFEALLDLRGESLPPTRHAVSGPFKVRSINVESKAS